MGAFFAKQPNGKFCRISTSADNFASYDITRDELVTYLTNTRGYGFCPGMGEKIDKLNAMVMEELEKELANPPEDGRFVSSFEEALTCLSMSNYETIDELRDILKEMGYEKWETFMPWDYCIGNEIKKVFDAHFDKIKEDVKKYCMPGDDAEENPYYQYRLEEGIIKSIDEVREAVRKINTLDDYYHYEKDVLQETDEDIIREMHIMGTDIKSLEKLLNAKTINDAFNAQFENHSYFEAY